MATTMNIDGIDFVLTCEGGNWVWRGVRCTLEPESEQGHNVTWLCYGPTPDYPELICDGRTPTEALMEWRRMAEREEVRYG